MPVEQFGETVVVLGHHHQCATTVTFATDPQCWLETFQVLKEQTLNAFNIVNAGTKACAHHEVIGHGVGELIVLKNVATQRHDGGGRSEHYPRLVVTLQGRDVYGHSSNPSVSMLKPVALNSALSAITSWVCGDGR